MAAHRTSTGMITQLHRKDNLYSLHRDN